MEQLRGLGKVLTEILALRHGQTQHQLLHGYISTEQLLCWERASIPTLLAAPVGVPACPLQFPTGAGVSEGKS